MTKKKEKMLKSIITLLLLSSLCSEIISLDPNAFCKLTERECSYVNAPYIYKCGRNMCTWDETACDIYLRTEKKIRDKWLTAFFRVRHHNEFKLKEDFSRLQTRIKMCHQNVIDAIAL